MSTLDTLKGAALVGILLVIGWLRGAHRRLAAAGQMALTNYVMETLVCILVFKGIGLALYGQLERFEPYYLVARVWIAQPVKPSFVSSLRV